MSQKDLIKRLKENTRALQSPRLEEAFRAVDRKFFVPEELQDEAYEDYPLPIGYGATISQPTTVAFMLEKLDVQEGQKVLDVGSGSGWTTALIAHLVGPKGTPPHQLSRLCSCKSISDTQSQSIGNPPCLHPQNGTGSDLQRESWCGGKVIGLEIVPELVKLGRQNLGNYYSLIRANKRIVGDADIRQARAGIVGLPSEGPYDRILVSAAARRVPKELIGQLKPDGVLVIPVGNEGEAQKIVRVCRKSDGKSETEEYPGFVFVPLR